MTLGQRMRRALCAFAAITFVTLLPAAAQAAGGATALDGYLDGLKTWQARFVQVVVDGRKREVSRGSGRLVIERPGKFRWEIAPVADGKPAAEGTGQLLVADGRSLWFFDRDLDQVTVKPMGEALAQTPAMLLTGAGDVREGFTLSADGRRDGLEWVKAVPRKAEADFSAASFGFAGKELRRLVLHDKLGQTATLTFEAAVRNGQVDPAELRFTAPAGVDVIGAPAG